MATQFEPELLCRRQNFPRLLDVEIAELAKNIAKLGHPLFRNARQHFVDHKVDILAGGTVARDGVSPEKCRYNFERRFLIQSLHHAQNLKLIVECKSVA